MSPDRTVTPVVVEVDRTGERLREILARAGDGPFVLDPQGTGAASERIPDAGNCHLAGGDPASRQVVAQLAGRVCSLERDLESLSAEILDRYEEVSLVHRLSQRLASASGEAEMTRIVVEEAVRVLSADGAELWLGGGGDVALAAAVPAEPAQGRTLSEQGPLAALREGQSWTREATNGGEAVLATPVPGDGSAPLGVLILRGNRDGGSFRTGSVRLVAALVSLASAFLRQSVAVARRRADEDHARVEETARQIQAGLVPDSGAVFPGVEIVGSRLAKSDVGGDFHVYLRLPDDSIAIALGEASGHGVESALRAAMVRAVLLADSRRILSPADLLRRAQETLGEELRRAGSQVAVFIARLSADGQRLDYSGAGHAPQIVTRADGRIELLEPSGPPLGLNARDENWDERSLRLAIGDTLLLFSDGLIDAVDADGNQFGLDRLIRIAAVRASADPERACELHALILADLERHVTGASCADEITLVVVGATGSRPGPGAREVRW